MAGVRVGAAAHRLSPADRRGGAPGAPPAGVRTAGAIRRGFRGWFPKSSLGSQPSAESYAARISATAIAATRKPAGAAATASSGAAAAPGTTHAPGRTHAGATATGPGGRARSIPARSTGSTAATADRAAAAGRATADSAAARTRAGGNSAGSEGPARAIPGPGATGPAAQRADGVSRADGFLTRSRGRAARASAP